MNEGPNMNMDAITGPPSEVVAQGLKKEVTEKSSGGASGANPDEAFLAEAEKFASGMEEKTYEKILKETAETKLGFEKAIADFEKELQSQCPTEYAQYMAGAR